MSKYTISLVLIAATFRCASAQTGCSLDVLTDVSTIPVLVTVNTNSFPYPNVNDSIYLNTEQAIDLACPGGKLNPAGLNVHGQYSMFCASGTRVSVLRGLYVEFPDISCTPRVRPFFETKYYSSGELNNCENGNLRMDIGYTVSENFYPVFSTCRGLYSVALYVKYEVNRWVRSGRNYPQQPEYVFSYGVFYEDALAVYEDYKSVFESNGLQDYINDVIFLTKGQLAAYDDFIYVFQRDATYDLINVAPQWSTFDEGNWRALENGVINTLLSMDLTNARIASGTLKIATLTNSTGETIELKLSLFINVPRWFWKLVFFPELNFGAIFFGYNNPYDEKSVVDAEFLAEICRMDVFEALQGSWELQEIDNTDQLLGFTYACALNTAQIIDPVISEIVKNFLLESNAESIEMYPKTN